MDNIPTQDEITENIIYFNNNVITLINFMAKLAKCSKINLFKDRIIRRLDGDSPEFIDTFALHTKKYEKEIMTGNEQFFLNFKQTGDQALDTIIFELKNIWIKLEDHNKTLLKDFIKSLFQMADNHITMFNRYNEILDQCKYENLNI